MGYTEEPFDPMRLIKSVKRQEQEVREQNLEEQRRTLLSNLQSGSYTAGEEEEITEALEHVLIEQCKRRSGRR